MVEPDRGDDAHAAVGDICRVPRPAHADFDDGDIDRSIGKRGERHCCHHLEEGERDATIGDRPGIDEFHIGLDVVPRAGKPRRGDGLAVEADALTGIEQVGRGEQAGSKAELSQQRFDDAGRCRLAIRSGDVDDGVRALGVAEEFDDRCDADERGLDHLLRPARGQFVHQGCVPLLLITCLGICHVISLGRAAR